MKTRRSPIKSDSITLLGESDGRVFERTFTISGIIGGESSASAVCWEASHPSSGPGVLKEFYPRDMAFLSRGEDGILTASKGTDAEKELFRKRLGEYLEPFDLLLAAKRRPDVGPAISAFIPAFEIYRSPGDGTAYVWDPTPKLETLDGVIRRIRREPGREPERKLADVMKAIVNLTECVRELHLAELIHRDIKPSNIGFIRRGDRTLFDAVRLFDLDTVCSVWNEDTLFRGSPGFTEPEAGLGAAPSNKTDIYSIGAVLFQAVCVCGGSEESGGLYRDEYYDDIREMVNTSRLIAASEVNSNPRFRNRLIRILKKALAAREARYPDAEEMLRDLNEALFYILPDGGTSGAGEKWVIKELSDPAARGRTARAVRYHLYEKPLRAASRGGVERILVVGFGYESQKFLDSALQAGQTPGMELEVKVAATDGFDRDSYLSDRPELSRFFEIDGSLKDADGESYGSVSFEIVGSVDLTFKRYAEGSAKDFMPDRVFIALGDDDTNEDAARAFTGALRGTGALVAYAVSDSARAKLKSPYAVPVYTGENAENGEIRAELERMALNTEIVYEGKPIPDPGFAGRALREAYRREACLAMGISIKYKLLSLGIDPDEGAEKAAARFSGMMEDKALFDRLVYFEHRRWVTEKLCSGYRGVADPLVFLNGATRDKRGKRHICLVRSREGSPLSEGFDWDDPVNGDISSLDPLDALSVRLYRAFREKAEELKRLDILNGIAINGVRSFASASPKTRDAFSEWYDALLGLLNGEGGIRLLDEKRALLGEAFGSVPEGERAMKALKAFDEAFYPVRAASERRSFKRFDEMMTESIPFILTYSPDLTEVIPMTDRGLSDAAALLAAAPKRAVFLSAVGSEAEEKKAAADIARLSDFIKGKPVKTATEFVLVGIDGYEPVSEGYGRVRLENTEALLKRLSRGGRLAVEHGCSGLSRLLEGMGIYGRYPHYSFDRRGMRFFDTDGCAELEYVKSSPFISVSDIIPGAREPEPRSDIRAITEVCRRHRGAWGRFAGLLERIDGESGIFAFGASPEGRTEALRFILPAYCLGASEKAVAALSSLGIVGEESRAVFMDSESCEISVFDLCGNAGELRRLFSEVYLLRDPDAVSVREEKGRAAVKLDSLRVRSPELMEFAPILADLEERGLILCPDAEGFTFGTRAVKRLLKSEKLLAEAHLFRELRSSGRLDDAARFKGFIAATRGFDSALVTVITDEGELPDARRFIKDAAEKVGAAAEVLSADEALDGADGIVVKLFKDHEV